MIVRAVGRERPPGQAAGAVGTVLIHATAATFLFATVHSPPKPGPEPVAVDLVAAPAPAPKARAAPEALPPPPVEKPAPVKSLPKPKPKPKPKAVTPPPKPRPEPVDREPPPKTQAPVTPAPGETPSTGTDVATVKTPGRDFPYQEYLKNILNQVYQRWDRKAATRSLSVEIGFSILSDGSVRDIQVTSKSGNYAFDLSAQGAIEAAGKDRAFGPLPKGWPSEVLPVSILFKPNR